MIEFFKYNWIIRDEWLKWCSQLPEEELLKERIGGMNSFLHTLFHIVDVEQSWMRDIKGEKESFYEFKNFSTLETIKHFSEQCKIETEKVVLNWNVEKDYEQIPCPTSNGEIENFTYGEILRHVIAHEIHHIGQLSIWSREVGLVPVSANLIRKDLFK